MVELYNHYWTWDKKVEEVAYKIREKKRKTRDGPPKARKIKEEIFFEKAGTDPKISGQRA